VTFRRFLVKAGTLVALCLLPSCSVVVRADVSQCKTDGDCTGRGPDFVGTACATGGPSKGYCVDELAVSENGECSANADCVDISGPGSICASNSGANRCQRVVTDECPLYVGDPFVERTVIFGVMGDIAPTDARYTRDIGIVAAAKLAVDEFQADKGIELNGKRRVAVVFCRQSTPRASSTHLVRLGAKAILGPTESARLLSVVEQAAPEKVPVFAGALDENPAAALSQAAGLVFLTGAERGSTVAAMSAYLGENKTPILTATGGGAALRVLTVLSQDNAGYESLLAEKLTFNGKTALQNQGDAGCDACYRNIKLTDGDVAAFLSAVAAFRPSVIVPIVDASWGTTFLPALEASFVGPAKPPIYLHPFTLEEDAGYRVLRKANPTLPTQRIAGLWPARTSSAVASFQDRYRAATSPKASVAGPTPNVSATRVYENMSFVLLAAYSAARSAPKGEFTGADLARAVANVTTKGAASVQIGPLGIVPAVQTLNRELGRDQPEFEKIDIDGIFTKFEFTSNQVATNPWQIWCLDGAKGTYEGTSRVFDGTAFSGGAPGLCN
jgi:hypothetical protein